MMLELTKIFRFEMAHAIHSHSGACKHVHGHSYELHVTVSAALPGNGYIPAPGFIIDFKELKNIVHSAVIEKLDHRLVLSNAFLQVHPAISVQENLCVFDAEPTAENLLIFIAQELEKEFREKITLDKLTLYETRDSYAVWHRSS